MSTHPSIKRPWNTKEKGLIEFVVFHDKKTKHFVGVCLTFDIVEEGDNPESLMNSLTEAAKLHVDVVQKENLSDELLNRYAPKKYWDKYLPHQSSLVLQDSSRRPLIVSSVASTSVSRYPTFMNNEAASVRV